MGHIKFSRLIPGSAPSRKPGAVGRKTVNSGVSISVTDKDIALRSHAHAGGAVKGRRCPFDGLQPHPKGPSLVEGYIGGNNLPLPLHSAPDVLLKAAVAGNSHISQIPQVAAVLRQLPHHVQPRCPRTKACPPESHTGCVPPGTAPAPCS